MTIVILAAGSAQRMGTQKLLLPIDGRAMIERVLEAAAAWPRVAVAGAQVIPLLTALGVRLVPNAEPQRGMSYSLRLANAVIAEDEAIAVLLADLPDISTAAIRRVVDAYDDSVDVVVPRSGDVFTHPVVFGPRARQKIAALPAGDTIRCLRDDPSMRRRIVETERPPETDIDTPHDYARRTRNAARNEPLA